MTEEQLTIRLLDYLEDNKWDILCFDYPQSGTGKVIHPNSTSSKTKGGIIPDIVAVKNGICLFFENKDHYFLPDFDKVNMLRTSDDYMDDINELTRGAGVHGIFYGIGFPTSCSSKVTDDDKNKVDFIVTVNDDETVHIFYNTFGLSF